MLNKGENKADIARAILLTVANQTITTLLAGAEIRSKILFAGEPLTFLPQLRKELIETLKLPENKFIIPRNSEVLVAVGAAVDAKNGGKTLTLERLIQDLQRENKGVQTIRTLQPLFESEKEYKEFKERLARLTIKKPGKEELINVKEMYLGIDVGTTTTKMVLINEENKIIDRFYSNNNGDPLEIATMAKENIKDVISVQPF